MALKYFQKKHNNIYVGRFVRIMIAPNLEIKRDDFQL
jgi:hypothetical protein